MDRKAAASSSTTKHGRVSGVLGSGIQDGTFKVGALQPSEPDPSDRFGVGRLTINDAISLQLRHGA